MPASMRSYSSPNSAQHQSTFCTLLELARPQIFSMSVLLLRCFIRARRPLVEALEEIVGELARHAVDEACAELRELAADHRFHGVREHRRGAFRRERHGGLAFGEAGDAALA